jgi:uncharacterized delta-60 repeat protein
MPRLTSITQRQLTASVRDYRLDLPIDVYVVGQFTSFAGVTLGRIARLNLDGTLDTAFNTNLGVGLNATSRAVSQLVDGSLLIAGSATEFDGTTISGLVKLNPDGTEDASFTANLGTGFDTPVEAIALQSDGKILVGGQFTTFDGNTRNRLVRLNSDGTEDTQFYTNLGTGFDAQIDDVKIQSDGKILVCGAFQAFNGNTRRRLIRLNADGTEDTQFYTNQGSSFSGRVLSMALQPDGKIIACGQFITFSGRQRGRILRLNADGTEDTGFYSLGGGGAGSDVNTVSLQPDGKAVFGGNFTSINGVARPARILRLNSDGTVDTEFDANLTTGFNAVVNSIAVQSDGKILVSGSFTQFNGTTRNRLVRLNADGIVDTGFYTNLGSSANNIINGVSVFRSPPPAATYAVSPAANNIDEGSSLTFTVSTANIRNDTVLRWRIIDRPEDFAVSTGTATITSNTDTITVTPLEDLLTDGVETFRVEVSRPTGTVLATSSSVTINDTSAATLTVTPQSLTLDEGDSVTVDVTVDSQDIPDGFVLYWTSSSADDTTIDSGSFEINDDAGSFTVTVANDFLTEGTETFTVSVRSGSVTGTIIATSADITVNDTSVETYAIQAAASTVDEGQSLNFQVTTQGVPNDTVLYWTVSRPEDFATASGSFTVNSNSGSFSVTPTADATTEGAETFTASVRTGSVSGTVRATSSAVTITDTSLTPTYSVSAADSSVTEGDSLQFTVTTTNVANGTTLYWTVSRPEDFSVSSGSFTVNSNSATFSVTPTYDLNDEGSETFTASVRIDSTSGTVVATSGSVTIVNLPAFEMLMIAGGGGGGAGGNDENGGPGGGGAGGYRYISSIPLNTGITYTVTVGGGGAAFARGGDSWISGTGLTESPSGAGANTIKAYGGGYGGRDASGQQAGASGGSGGGGGGGGWGGSYAGGAGNTPATDPSQGNNGGSSNFFGASSGGAGGGGGGAGELGANASGDSGGNGGIGAESSITGTVVRRAGGGGGRKRGGSGGTNGTGGLGGGGNAGSPGQGNTGGGGGALSTGGSGIIILKYPSYLTLTRIAGGLSLETSTAVPGYKITSFTAGTGTIQFS